MVSVSYLSMLLERFGMINFHRFHSRRRAKVQKVYVFVLSWLFVCRALSQTYSTVTRARRYLPEFIQTNFEEDITWFLIYAMYYFQKGHKDINVLGSMMDHGFSKADQRIIERTNRLSKTTCVAFFTIVCIAATGGFVETVIPISKAELDIRRSVYRTKHPERRLPYNLRVPFVDESTSWGYEVLYAMDGVIMFFLVMWVSFAVSLVPVAIIHLQGQYEILSKYISKIGQEHKDSFGNRIFYSNIENNDYVISMYTPVSRKNKLLRLRRERSYERYYLRQIIQFHRKLLAFQEKLIQVFSPIVIGLVFANNIIISLCLYQMVVDPTKISAQRYFKFTAELIAVAMEYFIILNCSEMADDCSGMLRSSLNNSSWENCSNQCRRDLCMLIRRVQRPNHLRFYDGAIVGSRKYFLDVCRVAYNFANYMRLNAS